MTYSNELGLIGSETFAIDGLRLPSNALHALTGTKEELGKRLEVYKKMAEKHTERRRRRKERYEERQICRGKRGQEIRSNATDNESALIMSPQGYIQGYIGIAVLDNRNQIIVSAEAAGNANESGYFADMLDDTMNNLNIKKEEAGKKRKRRILGDKNYFGEENLRSAEERGFEAMILDSQYKKRLGKNGEVYYEAADFKYDREQECFICPGGKELVYKGTMRIGGRKWGKRIRRI